MPYPLPTLPSDPIASSACVLIIAARSDILCSQVLQGLRGLVDRDSMCACNAPILSLSPSPSSPSPSRKRGRPRRDCRCGLWNPSFSFVSNVEHVLSSLMCLLTDRKPCPLGSDFHASFSLSHKPLHYFAKLCTLLFWSFRVGFLIVWECECSRCVS